MAEAVPGGFPLTFNSEWAADLGSETDRWLCQMAPDTHLISPLCILSVVSPFF